MNYKEFTRNLGKAGLTVNGFAKLLKYNRNSITNLSKNESIPKHLAIIAVLLGEMKDKGVDYEPLLKKMDIEHFKDRGKDISQNITKD